MSRILIAKDDRGIAHFIEPGLKSASYACDVVDSGPSDFALSRRGDFDVMLLDLGLPHMDARDVLERLRALGGQPAGHRAHRADQGRDRVRALAGGTD